MLLRAAAFALITVFLTMEVFSAGIFIAEYELKDVSEDETAEISSAVREAILSGGRYEYISPQTVREMLEEKGILLAGGASKEKAFETGRAVNAEYGIFSTVQLIGGDYYLIMRLLDTVGLRIVKWEKIKGNSVTDLTLGVPSLYKRLFGEEAKEKPKEITATSRIRLAPSKKAEMPPPEEAPAYIPAVRKETVPEKKMEPKLLPRLKFKQSPLYLNGSFETEIGSNYNNDRFRWRMWDPKHYLLLKLYSSPGPDFDIFGQFRAFSNWQGLKYLDLDQFHSRYHFSKLEMLFTVREERHWIDSPLLAVVNVDEVRDNYQARALRMDFWDAWKFSGTALLSKYITRDGWAFLSKFKRNVFYSRQSNSYLDIDGIFLYKYWANGFNKVMDADIRYSVKGITVTGEAALSQTENPVTGIPGFVPGREITEYFVDEYGSKSSKTTRLGSADCLAYRAEVRDVAITNYFKLYGAYYNYGKYFISEMSKRFNRAFSSDIENGRNGYYVEGIFLVPKYAVNIVGKRAEYSKIYDVSANNYITWYSRPQKEEWNYLEFYVKFVKGLDFKNTYEMVSNNGGVYRHAGIELTAENRMAFFKLSPKLKNIGLSTGAGEILEMPAETRINISDNLQFYIKYSIYTEYKNLWGSSFYQLKYFIGWDMELFAEYADNWGAKNSYQDNTLKFIMKMNF